MAIISNGTTIADAGAFSVNLGSMVHIKTLTASSSSTLSFVHGASSVVLDGTYPIYKFQFININPASNAGIEFQFNLSIDGGSNYNVTKTTSVFGANNAENGGYEHLLVYSGFDLAQSTSDQVIAYNVGNDSDECASGELTIFNPSNTTFMKHFITSSSTVSSDGSPEAESFYVGGYANTTSAVNAIQFKMASGNIDAGKIKLYGIKDS